MHRLLAVVGIVAMVLGWGAIIQDSVVATYCFVAIVLTAGQVLLLTRAAGGFTPALVPVLLINAIMLLGFLMWDDLAVEAVVSARIAPNPEQLALALKSSLWFTTGLTLGAMVVGPASVGLQRSTSFAISGGVLVAASYLLLALRLYGRGSDTLRAAEYLDFSGPVWAASLGGALTPVGMLIISYAVFLPGGHRLLAGVGLCMWFLSTFGASSRQLALLPTMLLLGRVLALGPFSRAKGAAAVVAAGAATAVLAQVVLVLRGNPGGVGILTLTEVVWTRPGRVLGEITPGPTLGNVLFSVPLIGRVASLPASSHTFWTSVNPLPGSLTDWPVIAPGQRLNVYTPFAGLGELAAQGTLYVVVYGLVAGMILSLASRAVAGLNGSWRAVGSLAVLALATLFSVTLLQYNLRTGTRLLWYAATGMVGLRLALLVFARPNESPVSIRGRVRGSVLAESDVSEESGSATR